MSRSKSILISLFTYVLVIVVLALTMQYYSHYPILWRVAIADLIATVLIFISSMLFNNSSMYDPYWSVKPFVIGVYYFLLIPAGEISLVQILALIMISLYALRLTTNFYRGWPGLTHEDWRYRNFRKQFPSAYWLVSFFGIHFFPTLMVYLGCLPMLVIFTQPLQSPLLAWAGLILLGGSVLLAYLADEQMHRFRKNTQNTGKTMQAGLWAFSRHPNYLGEILTWWGLLLLALAAGWHNWWTGVGALLITLMFVFISIPLIEKYAQGRREDYKDYIRTTPMLLPLGKKKSL